MQRQIKDSGARQEFATGAVRDIQEGKGRCDLMPLDVVPIILRGTHTTLKHLEDFKMCGEIQYLHLALTEYFQGFSAADIAAALLDLSIHFEQGAVKYGENNWQKGIPCSRYIDSAVRHYLKMQMELQDEPHDRAFLWNLVCCLWTAQYKPELNNYVIQEGE